VDIQAVGAKGEEEGVSVGVCVCLVFFGGDVFLFSFFGQVVAPSVGKGLEGGEDLVLMVVGGGMGCGYVYMCVCV
jgi:hypothetical protein